MLHSFCREQREEENGLRIGTTVAMLHLLSFDVVHSSQDNISHLIYCLGWGSGKFQEFLFVPLSPMFLPSSNMKALTEDSNSISELASGP